MIAKYYSLSPEEETKIKTIKSLVTLYQYNNMDKVEQIADIALKLFILFKKFHKLSRVECFWLYYAALLHDIGFIEGPAKHHLRTQERILESKLLPFSPREKLIISCIARYHRKALPSLKHAHFAALNPPDQRIVSILASFLRLAVELIPYLSFPMNDIKLRTSRDNLLITCSTNFLFSKDEVPKIKRKDLLESVTGKKVAIHWKTTMLV